MADSDFLHDLVTSPREALSIEVKSWLDLVSPEGEAKIAKCLMALRNHGGGFMVFGFDNKTLLPTNDRRPSDLRAAFHTDRIQHLVSKFSSVAFEIKVHFPKRDDFEFPVIEVPDGITTPVSSKADCIGANGNHLIRIDQTFVRSLDSNGVVSTTLIGHRDWARLIETCFDNREADIGRFIRRHLTGVSLQKIRDIATALLDAGEQDTSGSASEVEALPPPRNESGAPTPLGGALLDLPVIPTAAHSARQLLADGLSRFRSAVAKRGLALPPHGSTEFAATIVGPMPEARATIAFRDTLLSSNPNYTGWPVWTDSRRFQDERSRPYFNDEGWEALIEDLRGGTSDHLDFWRLEPTGRFYLYRGLQDDISRGPSARAPLTVLDFGLPIWRTAEAIAVAIEFARRLAPKSEVTSLSIGFRWSGLEGRELSSWAQPERYLSQGRKSYRDEAMSIINVPLRTPLSALPGFVRVATEPLYECFDGFEMPIEVIEEMVKELLGRRRR